MFLMLTCNIAKERKMDENRKIRAMTLSGLSLNPMIQSFMFFLTLFSLISSFGQGESDNFVIRQSLLKEEMCFVDSLNLLL